MSLLPGAVFEHRHWLDAKHQPLLCKVTAVRNGTVYWAAWEPGEQVRHGKWRFEIDEADRVVGRILEPYGAGG